MQPPKVENFNDLFHLSDYKQAPKDNTVSTSLQESSHDPEGVTLQPWELGGLITGGTLVIYGLLHTLMHRRKHPSNNKEK